MPRKKPTKRTHKTTPPPLSLREIRFAQLYAESDNATRSYIDAGYIHASENAAAQGAKSLLRKPQIKTYVDELRAEAADVARETVNRLARSLSLQAHADRTRVFDREGRMKPPCRWPKELRSIIAGVEVDNIEEWRTDRETGEKKKEVVGYRWKVRFEKSIEAKKILAQWRKMIGGVAELQAQLEEIRAEVRRGDVGRVPAEPQGTPGGTGDPPPADPLE